MSSDSDEAYNSLSIVSLMSNKSENVAKRDKWLQSEDSSIPGDVSEEKPRKSSRIGDEYQAQIPDFITENDRLQSSISQDAKSDDVQNQFQIGHAAKKIDSRMGTSLISEPDSMLDDRSWSDSEKDSFLLGLYLFGKNFRLVNKFIGNIGIRNILPYYYGTFYRTAEHQKWSTFQKRKHKKIIPGKKIFTGWRQQELFARLFPSLTNECKARLTQASRMYDFERLPYETYVFTVRDKVGIDRFIEAVSIGKDKKDLTIRAKKPVENKLPPISSLETDEIIVLLKYGIGLSKERLSDLFWEAVWPRLLARGWHSELSKSYAFQSSTETLVFIVPGIKKFSKRGLEKGTQYYESYIDVLNKVASEPQLIELKPDQMDPDANHGSDHDDVMQFMIADSSNVHIGEMMVTVDDLMRSEWSEIKEDVRSEECLNKGLNDENCLKSRGKRHHNLNKNLKKRKSKVDEKSSGEHEGVKEPSPKKKRRRRLVIKAITNVQPELSKPTDGNDNADQHTPDDRTQTRKRPTTSSKSLEAVAGTGSEIPEKKRRGPKEKTPMHILAETVLELATGYLTDESDHSGDDHSQK
ncbi:hypothetical protein L6452_43327 [Arctium lappa]|uniref:Uncharacterized protein n=1 Tax=Arctium lappa TaxID=4217 RepID=A0ACB8XMI3_ARCLA|nr:hypothetical protein L6452_43327 [Arctium lappa]